MVLRFFRCGEAVASRLTADLLETTRLHGGDRLWVLHEGLPDEGCAKVFRHKQTNTEVDTQYIRVEPVQIGVECVAEAVAAPGIVAIRVFQ